MLFATGAPPVDQLDNECMAREKTERMFRKIAIGIILLLAASRDGYLLFIALTTRS
jgi:hypothetical protein